MKSPVKGPSWSNNAVITSSCIHYVTLLCYSVYDTVLVLCVLHTHYIHIHVCELHIQTHTHTPYKGNISHEMQSPKANTGSLHCFHTQHNSHSNQPLQSTSRARAHAHTHTPTNCSRWPWQHQQSPEDIVLVCQEDAVMGYHHFFRLSHWRFVWCRWLLST